MALSGFHFAYFQSTEAKLTLCKWSNDDRICSHTRLGGWQSCTGSTRHLRAATISPATAAAGSGGKTKRVASRGYLWWHPWNRKWAVMPQYPSAKVHSLLEALVARQTILAAPVSTSSAVASLRSYPPVHSTACMEYWRKAGGPVLALRMQRARG